MEYKTLELTPELKNFLQRYEQMIEAKSNNPKYGNLRKTKYWDMDEDLPMGARMKDLDIIGSCKGYGVNYDHWGNSTTQLIIHIQKEFDKEPVIKFLSSLNYIASKGKEEIDYKQFSNLDAALLSLENEIEIIPENCEWMKEKVAQYKREL